MFLLYVYNCITVILSLCAIDYYFLNPDIISIIIIEHNIPTRLTKPNEGTVAPLYAKNLGMQVSFCRTSTSTR